MSDFPRARSASGTASPSGLPVRAKAAWIGLGALFTVILLAVAIRDPRAIAALEEGATAAAPGEDPTSVASTAEPPPPVVATAAELDAARRGGLAPLGALAEKFPNDPTVLEALLVALSADRPSAARAIELAGRLFELRPEAASDDDVRRAFVRLSSGSVETIPALFQRIDQAPGESGPDLLFAIATAESPLGKTAKDRALKLLDGVETKKRASPALRIALDLKAALPCARKALFAAAQESGDARALPFLKPLVGTSGCKRLFMAYDCYSCLGNRAELQAAIAAIETRDPAPR